MQTELNTDKQIKFIKSETTVVNPKTKAEFRRFYEILANKRRHRSTSGRYTPPDNNERSI